MTAPFWTDRRVREALGLAAPDAGAAEPTYLAVSTDTRTLAPGALFVALAGGRFDGHAFLDEAVARGARGVVVREGTPAPAAGDVVVYHVPDTLAALGALGRYRRRHLVGARVCAITGTAGKTTTKEMVRAALATRYRVHATTGNLNNLVGTPLTLLAAPDDAGALVIEVGTNAPGEIATLAGIVEPDAAIITAIGEGHLEGLGSVAGVLEEKVSLLRGLRPGGIALVADEPPQLAARAAQLVPELRVAGWSDRAHPDFRATELAVDDEGRPTFRWRGHAVRLRARGRANARNALLALGLATEWGVDPAAAIEAVCAVEPPAMRTELRRIGPIRLLADCYNSNPASLQAAVELLVAMERGAGRVAVVGTMRELGARSDELHERAARSLADAGVDLIVATGEFVRAFEPLAGTLGDRLIRESDPIDAYARLAPRLSGGEVVLLKGSRGVQLERLIPLFERDFGEAPPAAAGAGNGDRSGAGGA